MAWIGPKPEYYGQTQMLGDPMMAPMQDVASTSPFVWGAGGTQLTPEQLASKQAIAQSLMKSDYSPVGSVWQGLGRVVDNVTGALQARKLDKQAAANSAYSAQIAQTLVDPQKGGTIAAQAMIDPRASPEVQKLAGMVWERANPKPTAPHYWETNNGSLGVIGADGKPTIIYQDPTPKIDWITAQNPDGTKTLVPMQQGGGMPGAAVPTAPVGKLTPISGGPSLPAAGGFSVPSGNPLEPPWP